MDILFTGGASRDPKSLEPSNLSRLKCKLFDCKNNDERKSTTNTPKYSEKVLTGNWYEERTICPCPTDEWITVYSTNYKNQHVNKDSREEAFKIWKYKQKLQGAGRALTFDDDSYIDNMTSSYDLSFRILPRGLFGPRSRVYDARKNAWIPETELALSYGSQTKYGLAKAIKEKQSYKDESISPLRSIYQIDYIEKNYHKDLNDKRFPKLRLDMNTPDLRHLGINLSSTSRPTAREPQYRDSRCEKICAWL